MTKLLQKNVKWNWDIECQSVFELLKKAFTEAPVLRHFRTELPIIVESDASDYAIASIISQYNPGTGEFHPIAFFARGLVAAELNYDVYDKEMLAIVESFKQWRAYLEGAKYKVEVFTDHNNLQWFTTTKNLTRRQARWSEFLSGFDFHINYRPGRLGTKPDALTRRGDVYPKKGGIVEANKGNQQILLNPEQLLASLILNDEADIAKIRKSTHDSYWKRMEEVANSDHPGPFKSENGLLLREGKIYVPKELRLRVLQTHHDHKLRGHPGIRKTQQVILGTYFWPGLHKDVKRYVLACQDCQRGKSSRLRKLGLLKPLPIGERPWSSISVDHIVELPMSGGHDAIMVVVCRLTKQAIFVPCHTTDNSDDLAKLFIRDVFSKHGLPVDIVSDRGTMFTSKLWTSLCDILSIRQNLSTAYHPQTDGQTERTNQTLEQYLRMFVNYDQDDWVEWLPLAEFVFNNTPSDATGLTPFFANKGYHPRLTLSLKDVPSHKAHLKAQELKQVHEYLKEGIQQSNRNYEKQANRSRREESTEWRVGTKVWLNTKNIRTKRPSKKLDYKKFGPFRIKEKISNHAYRLELPGILGKIHDVFHVDLLSEQPTEYFPNRKPAPQPPIEIEGEEEYEVKEILDCQRSRGRMLYLVRWEGYGPEFDTWEPIAHLPRAQEAVEEFHILHPIKTKLKDHEWERETQTQ
jgi:hypothetical protein